MVLFFGTGAFGIIIGNNLTGMGQPMFMATVMGVVNLCLGGLVGWILFTRPPRDSRKKRKKHRDDN